MIKKLSSQNTGHVKLKNMMSYVKHASDLLEVAIIEGRYAEEYHVDKKTMPASLTEPAILAHLATHFREQGFRVKIFQHDDESSAHLSFLRILWNYAPYEYPPDNSFFHSLFSRLPFGKNSAEKKIKLTGRARAAFEAVRENDDVSEAAALMVEQQAAAAFRDGKKEFVIRKGEMRRLLADLLPEADVLLHLDASVIIEHLEAKGYGVKVRRMFTFKITAN